MSEAVDRLIAYCRENDRVCPLPKAWQQLWEMLPEKRQAIGAWEPAVPLIGAASEAPVMLKMARLAEHIQWAAKHSALPEVAAFLRGLREDEWQHLLEEAMTKEKLLGPWQLVFFKATAGDKVSYPLGEHPGGYIEITPTRYWVMLIDPTRKAPGAATLTDAESVALMKSHVAYTGKYDVDPAQTPDGIKITIHVDAASNQALTGNDRVLYARVDGNKLRLKSPALVVGTSGVTSVIQIEYVKAE